MYSSLKTFSAFTIILAVANTISAVLVAMLIQPNPDINATMFTAIVGILATSALALLIIGIALWNLHGDMEANISSTNDYISSIKKRLDALENK